METELRQVTIEEYWPLIVKNTAEFGQIAVAENPEFNYLASCIYRVLKDSFIDADMTEYGVSRWEKILKLVPAETDTLDDRKARILYYLSVKLPYTWRVLKQMLTDYIGDAFVMDYINDEGKLVIHTDRISEDKLQTIKVLLDNVLPKNIEVERYNHCIYLSWRGEKKLAELMGDVAYMYEYVQDEDKFVLHTDRAADETVEQIDTLLASEVSGVATVEQYNHNMEISWRDINKYADCTTREDMLAVNEDYKNDVTSEGEWVYPLPKLHIDMQDNTNPPFKGSSIKIFSVDVPSTTNGDYLFCESASLEEVNMDFSHFTSVRRMFQYAMAFKKFPENFNPQTRDFTGLLVGAVGLFNKNAEGKVMIPYHPVLNDVVNGTSMFHLTPVAESYWTAKEKLDERYTFDHLVIGSQMFRNGWDYLATGIGGDIVLNLVSLEDGEWMFGGNFISSFTSPLPKLRIGNHMFSSRDVRLFSVFNSELPSLESGNGMFNNVKLDKASALRVLNSIPAYTSGSHPLTIGIHIDHQTDEEVLAAIANAEAKGWTLTVQWNGTPTSGISTTDLEEIWCKVTECEYGEYTDENGNRCTLEWGHYVTDTTEYKLFYSLVEAEQYFKLTKVNENE